MTADPIALFGEAFARAKARGEQDPTAMTLATVDHEHRPSVRVVLLKDFDARGFVFYTNRLSRKGRELDGFPFAALCFHWPKGEEQIRIEGAVTRVTDEESDAYFATRPRGSQIGAWASLQSEVLASRDALLARVAEVEARFEGGPVERPPHWGGYRVMPRAIEFWQGRADRLHERRSFAREVATGAWVETRLFP